eukprot:6468947-Amphidinium_carterae.1
MKASGMVHEGTIPESASRMTMAEIILSFGHGLKGLLPSIPGTVLLLSLCDNSLEGHLPELHISVESMLLVYANDFSCKLPRHGEVKPSSTASIALIGNHFAHPQHLPAWITTAEQPSDMFCVSNEQGKRSIVLLTCGVCLLCLAAFKLKRSTPLMLARAKSAWYEASQQHCCLVVASCCLLPTYNNLLWLACTVVADHMRLHFIVATKPAEAFMAIWVHAFHYFAAADFQRRHALQQRNVPRSGRQRGSVRPQYPGTRIYSLWILVCVLTSAPGVLYSVATAVPGFLRVSSFWQWFCGKVVALVSGLVTGFGLEFLAGKMAGPKVDGVTLQMLGLLLASILLPGPVLACNKT